MKSSRPLAVVVFLGAIALAGCTGGTEGTAAEEATPQKNGVEAAQTNVDPQKTLDAISPAIPLYAGAAFRADLTKRDEVMVRNQYGPQSEVYTLATDDSFPQVYHYYATYLAQFRAYPSHDPYPPEKQDWRTMEVQLNQAMQDPFIPGATIPPNGKQVILQVAETEAEPKTVIRYIVMPAGTAMPAAPTTVAAK